jgi:hypothetical protein
MDLLPPGAGLGTMGAPLDGAPVTGAPSSTVDPKPALLVARMESDNDVIMNNAAEIVVALESTVADPRGPKAVCEPIPPNAPAKSAALPLCSKTTMIRNRHTTMCTSKNSIYIRIP